MAHDKLYGFDDCKCRKEVLSKEQTQKKYMCTYKSLSDISSSFNVNTRIDTVVEKMAIPSVAMYTVTDVDNGYYPDGENQVTITKFADGSTNIISKVNGIRYTKDTLVDASGKYNSNWDMLAKIVKTKSGTMTINGYNSMFTNIINNLDGYGNVIPIFTFTSLGGLSAPPRINVNTLVESNMLWLCATSNEPNPVTFSYTVILLGV